jgi:AcrR family transcriptional regulator
MPKPDLASDPTPTRVRLLHAAEEEFGLAGFAGARLADISARAGIRRSSLLYHFSSKDLLYTAVVERTLADIAEAILPTLRSGGSTRERIMAPVQRFAGFLETRPSAARILLREILDDRGPGREIVVKQGVPLIALVETFLQREGSEYIPAGYPLRALLMQAVSNLLLWAVAGRLREPLWGGHHNAPELVGALWNMQPEPTGAH